jgi:hypothetical protein
MDSDFMITNTLILSFWTVLLWERSAAGDRILIRVVYDLREWDHKPIIVITHY